MFSAFLIFSAARDVGQDCIVEDDIFFDWSTDAAVNECLSS